MCLACDEVILLDGYLVCGSLCKCDLNTKYNNARNCGECVLFSFFSSLISPGFWLVC